MANLQTTIERIFEDRCHGGNYYGRQRAIATSKKYMEIPITSDTFELPILTLPAFKEMLDEKLDRELLVVQLYSYNNTSQYRSMDAIMKDVLSTEFGERLIKIEVPGSTNYYYGTIGAVFDKDFKPLMMMSWIMERERRDDNTIKYRYKKPLLRLNPVTLTSKEDALLKWLGGRLLSNTLNTIVAPPYFYSCFHFIRQSQYYPQPRVEIDVSPFTLRSVDTPSVSVTNESLLNIVEQHIEEILQ